MDKAAVLAGISALKQEAAEQYQSFKRSMTRVKEQAKKESDITISVAVTFVGIPIGTFVSGRVLGPERKSLSAVIGVGIGVASAAVAIMKPQYASYALGGVSMGGGFVAPAVYDFAVGLRTPSQEQPAEGA